MENSKEEKKKIILTDEVAEIIGAQTGYTKSSVQQIIRGYLPYNKRYELVFKLYNKIMETKEKEEGKVKEKIQKIKA